MISRGQLSKRISNWWQIAGVQRSRLVGGKADGVETIDFRTGGGLRLQLLPGRGMDIGLAEYKGIPISWLSATGVTHPSYFSYSEDSFLDSCGGGLLFTCGLTQVGAPCTDGGEALGMHGRISNIPAQEVSASVVSQNDELVIQAAGTVSEISSPVYHVSLSRSYRSRLGDNKVMIQDTVENRSSETIPHMILYHFNFGFPFLDVGASVHCPSLKVQARDEYSESGIDHWSTIEPPSKGLSEQVFYHELEGDAVGNTRVSLHNPRLGLRCELRFNLNELPRFVQWKSLNDSIYALGMEPANCTVQGRSHDREEGILQFLAPGGRRSYRVELAFVEDSGSFPDLYPPGSEAQ